MANEMVNAIKGNDRLDIRAVATAGDAVVAANVTAAASAITALSTEVKGTGWTSGMTLKAHDDAIVLVNARDQHLPVHATQIIKHPLMAVATYDFDVHGGEIGEIDLTTNAVIPDNAIITDVVVDVVTAIVTTDAGGTITFQLPTDGNLTSLIGDTVADIFAGVPGTFAIADGDSATDMAEKKAASYLKTTAERKIQAKIETKAVTAGKVNIFVWYIVSE